MIEVTDMGSGVFGSRPAGVMALVDQPASRVFAAKSRRWFFGSGISTAALVCLVGLAVWSPVAAALFGVAAGMAVGFAVALVVRAWPVLRMLWHWAAEIAAASGLAIGSMWLTSVVHPVLVAAQAVALVLALLAVPPVRRAVAAWVWCAVVRHRLRLCFAEFIRSASRLAMHAGSHPLILLARSTPAGERVWVWLRPGLELTDLEDRVGKLAVACWASEVRVVRASERYAALIRVDVTRRDPLRALGRNPLGAAYANAAAGSVDVPVPIGLELPEIPEQVPQLGIARPRSR